MAETCRFGPATVSALVPYPDYKDSGVEWLGEVPAHWDVRRFGSIGRIMKCSGGTKADEVAEGIPCIRYGDLYTYYESSIEHSRAFVSPDTATAYSKIQYGDLLFAASGETVEEIGKSAVNLIEGDARCGGDVVLLRPTISMDAGFMGYVADAPYVAYQKSSVSRGMTVIHFYGNQLKDLRVLLPSVTEQRGIADFLDRETARIDSLIAKQEALIDLLQEKRTSLINHAVTRGLDPDAVIRDSGIEWLAEVPAHWDVRRLRTVASITTGNRDTVDRQPDGRYPFFVRSPVVERIDTWSFDGEAVLTAGDGVGVAKVFHYVSGKFDFHQRVYKFSDFNAVLGKFFYRYFAASLRFETLRGTAKSTVDSLRLPMLQNLPVAIPPLVEQHAIIAHLDRETAAIDALVAKVKDAIDRLKEYRTALIAAAVTGKIDVRNHPETEPADTTRTGQVAV